MSVCKDNARRVKKLGTYSKDGHSLPEIRFEQQNFFIIRSSTYIRMAIKTVHYKGN